jgi:hypothetical protein
MGLFLTLFWWFAVNSRNSRFGGFNSRLAPQKFPFNLLRELAHMALIGLVVAVPKAPLSRRNRKNSRLYGNYRESGYGGSFDMMIVPEAANMPPTPWQTEILAPGIWAGAVPRIWRTLSCNAYMPYMPECI